MSAPGVNVLRWGALVAGVFYGFTHQSAIRSSDTKHQAQQAWDHKVKLIDDAKAEYARKNAPPGSGDGVITDPDNPSFDLEKYLTKVAKDSS